MQLSAITVMLSAFLAPSTGHRDSGTFFIFCTPFFLVWTAAEGRTRRLFSSLCDRGFSLSYWILPLGVWLLLLAQTHIATESSLQLIMKIEQKDVTGLESPAVDESKVEMSILSKLPFFMLFHSVQL